MAVGQDTCRQNRPMLYPTDLTDSQWQILEKELNDHRKRKHSLRSIWDALFYLSKTGCQWRMLPLDFPKWQLVYYYFRKWTGIDKIEALHDIILRKVRRKKGRKSSPSLGLIDSQSVKSRLHIKGKRNRREQENKWQKATYYYRYHGRSIMCGGTCGKH